MKKARWGLTMVICVFAFCTLLCNAGLVAAIERVEIVGTVYTSAWDDNDNATACVIVTDEGEEINVSKSGKGMELLGLDSKSIRASGNIATDEAGRKTITVASYTIVGE
jgi:hypothetical protein